jgi:hypothetical protein
MSDLLEKAFTEAKKLPKKERDAFAAWMLEELKEERLWNREFKASGDKLTQLANEALEEHLGGKTRPLDIDKP